MEYLILGLISIQICFVIRLLCDISTYLGEIKGLLINNQEIKD